MSLTYAVYANSIDFGLSQGTIQEAAAKLNVNWVRVISRGDLALYDRILVLGGHLAYEDEFMPENAAKEHLSESEKEYLVGTPGAGLVKTLRNPFGDNPDQWLVILAGATRVETAGLLKMDTDQPSADRLDSIDEFFFGSDPIAQDTDGDSMPDGEELDRGTNPLEPRVPRDKAIEILFSEVVEPSPTAGQVVIHMVSEPLNVADAVSPLFSDQSRQYVINESTWFAFVDDHPGAIFEHPVRFAFIVVRTGEISVVDEVWWPLINGVSIWELEGRGEIQLIRIYGG